MDDLRYVCFKTAFTDRICFLICVYLAFFHSRYTAVFDPFDPVNDHIIVKWLHNVIRCPHIDRIFRDTILSDRTDHDKCRVFFYCFILVHTAKYSKSIQLWHHNIEKYDIRFFCFYHTISFLTVFCCPHHIQFVITFDNIS